MTLNIILTSYNRPKLIKRAVVSILAQTDDRWRLHILDDNSNKATKDYLKSLDDKRITVKFHKTTDKQRGEKSRYAVLINSLLPTLKDGIVGYLCDNVEYKPDLVETVLGYFDTHANFAGYVVQERDVYINEKFAGTAASYGHWPVMPQSPGRPFGLASEVPGNLDHSQVFHRLPVDLQWNEDIEAVGFGDAYFYSRLVVEYGPIGCIDVDRPLTLEHIPK